MRSIKQKIGIMGRPMGSLAGNFSLEWKGWTWGMWGTWVVREWVVGVSGAMWVATIVAASLCGTFYGHCFFFYCFLLCLDCEERTRPLGLKKRMEQSVMYRRVTSPSCETTLEGHNLVLGLFCNGCTHSLTHTHTHTHTLARARGGGSPLGCAGAGAAGIVGSG